MPAAKNTRSRKPGDDMPEDIDAFRNALAREIMTFLEAHKTCAAPACRRARRCTGAEAGGTMACQADTPEASEEEWARTRKDIADALAWRLAQG